MSQNRLLSFALELGDEPINVRYGTAIGNESPYAVIDLGPQVRITVTDTSPATLRRLAEAATEVADWREQQTTTPTDATAEEAGQ